MESGKRVWMGGGEVMRDGEGIKRVSKKRGGIEQSSYVDASSMIMQLHVCANRS